MWVGIFLICMGILYIMSNTGVIQGDVWDYILPVFLILLGASIIIKRVRRDNKTNIPTGNQK